MRVIWTGGTAVGTLRVLLVASLVVPLLLFAVFARFQYLAVLADAERGAARAAQVACEHAVKVFDIQRLMADRVVDMLAGKEDGAIRADEANLHESLVRMIRDLPEVGSLIAVAADGHLLLATAAFPASRVTLFNDRDYFVALRSLAPPLYISKVQVSRVSGKPFFGLARRREVNGAFAGLVDIAIAPGFFSRFYETLLDRERETTGAKVIALVREDGQILVRYPGLDGAAAMMPPSAPFLAAIKASPGGGSYDGRSVLDGDEAERLYFYQRVRDYPVYIVVGQSTGAILADWFHALKTDVAFGVPATVALCLITWTALRRTQREQAALAQARAEVRRRQAAEAALQEAQRLEAVGRLTGGVAHDFNNLLTIVLGNVEMMIAHAEDPARVRRLGASAVLATQRGAGITQKLLAFARRQLVRPERVDLNRLLIDFKPLLEHGAGQTTTVALDLTPDLEPAWLDRGQFEAVILNLVINARDAMPDGGTVVVATGIVDVAEGDVSELAAGRYIHVAVTDSGTGMSATVADRAFEPFFTTKDVGKGTGLGLSQVYGFAKQAGGNARIRSAPGKGTTVDLLLPRAVNATAPPSAAKQETAEPRAARAGEVVLLVEDDPSILDILVESLGELGYVTRVASQAESALAWLRGPERIDLLFSDVLMPGGMNGVELAREARRLRPSLKILLTSGYAAATVGGDELAALPLLEKPYDRQELARSLRAALSN